MAEVVSINPAAPSNTGEPDPLVVERLDVALAQAKRGEILAVGIAVARPNGTCSSGYAFPGAQTSGSDATTGYHQLVSAIVALLHRLQTL